MASRFCFFFIVVCCATASARPSKLVYMMEWTRGDGISEKQIVLSEGDGSRPRFLTSGPLFHLYPEIDAAGHTVTYVEGPRENKLDVVTLDLKKGILRTWTNGEGQHLHPDLSGDGRLLAFSAPVGPNGRAQIVVVDMSAENRRIIPSDYNCYFPALSSDGSFVVFQRSRSKKEKDIVLYRLNSGKLTVLSRPNDHHKSPNLSFDDRFVAHTMLEGGDWDIAIRDLRSGRVWRLSRPMSQDYAPTFRPDGSVLFASGLVGERVKIVEVGREEWEKGLANEPKVLVESHGDVYSPAVSGRTDVRQSLLPPLPVPARSSFGAIRFRNRVFIVGGHQGKEHTYPPESFLPTLESFDFRTKQWKAASPRPVPAHGYGVARWGRYIYAFGGFAHSQKHNPKWKSLDRIDRYDLDADRWELVGQLPRRRSSNVVAQVGSRVYLIGGWDSTPRFDKDYEGRFHGEIDVFDARTEKVSVSEHRLPPPLRRALSSVIRGDEIILVGGLGQGSTHFELMDHVTAFNPRTGRWRELPRLPFATFAPAAGAIDHELFVFGGMFKTGPTDYDYVNHIFSLATGAGHWVHSGRYLSETKGFSQVVDLGGQSLLLLGGHKYEGDEDHPVRTFEVFGVNGRREVASGQWGIP